MFAIVLRMGSIAVVFAVLSATASFAGINDPIVHWTFDDSGNITYDDSGNGHNLTIPGTWASVPGVQGNAVQFFGYSQGSTNWSSSPEGPYSSTSGMNYPTSEGFAVSYWTKLEPGTQARTMDYWQHRAGGQTFGLYNNVDRGEATFYLRHDFSDPPQITASASSSYIDDWVHLTGVYEPGPTPTAKLYVNGQLVGSRSMPGPMRTSLPPNVFVSGSWHNTGPSIMDDVRLYNHALSSGEVVALYGGEPSHTPRPDPIPDPVPSSGRNLVVLTHGWNTSSSGIQETWVPFRNAIQDAISASGRSDDWSVWIADWHAGSLTGPFPNLAYNHALNVVGPQLGGKIAEGNYDHVHLIAHSAGSAAISMASEYVKAMSPDTRVHTTFLDPYVPLGARDFYGNAAEWADNYFTVGGFLTGGFLPNAHNVDITALDPDGGPVSTHSWPLRWYQQTVDATAPAGSGDYGYPLSLEDGGWNPAGYPVGNEPTVLGGGTAGPANLPKVVQNPVMNVAIQSNVTSETGTVNIMGSRFSMLTGSPVWMTTLVETDGPVNFLTFEAEFTSQEGAEGLLSIFWNSELIGTIDERYVLEENREYTLFLPKDFETGNHVLSFRLDPFTETASSILIDNVSTGFITPEPGTAMLLVVSILGIMRRRRTA